jgi:hypothetical protein
MVGLLVFTLACSACGVLTFARLSVNEPIKAEDLAFIAPGKTTLHDIVERIGAPNELAKVEGGVLGVYYFLDAKYSKVNFGWVLRFWSPVDPDLILSKGGLGMNRLEVRFDPTWVVRDYGIAHHAGVQGFVPQPF